MTSSTKIRLADVHLERGDHRSPEQGMCVMELAAYLSPTSQFTDHPACVSPALGAFLRSWNDALDDATRQKLKPYARKVLDTAGNAKADARRAWLATDYLVRTVAPAFLTLAKLDDHARALSDLHALDSREAARHAQPSIDAARDAARGAARDAARDAAGAAARAAAGAVAVDAAGAVAGAAAWAAAGAAAGGAARAAAWAAAWAAAGDAAWAVARDAAWAAAWDAARAAAWAAARDAAGAALAPTVERLQRDAFKLLDAMIAA